MRTTEQSLLSHKHSHEILFQTKYHNHSLSTTLILLSFQILNFDIVTFKYLTSNIFLIYLISIDNISMQCNNDLVLTLFQTFHTWRSDGAESRNISKIQLAGYLILILKCDNSYSKSQYTLQNTVNYFVDKYNQFHSISISRFIVCSQMRNPIVGIPDGFRKPRPDLTKLLILFVSEKNVG